MRLWITAAGLASAAVLCAMAVAQPTAEIVRKKVHTGEEFSVKLESNPTTGYSWRMALSPDPGVVQSAGDRYVAPNTEMMGAPGQEIWTFRAVGEGSTRIVLEYVRPWEKDVPPARTHEMIVVVR